MLFIKLECTENSIGESTLNHEMSAVERSSKKLSLQPTPNTEKSSLANKATLTGKQAPQNFPGRCYLAIVSISQQSMGLSK